MSPSAFAVSAKFAQQSAIAITVPSRSGFFFIPPFSQSKRPKSRRAPVRQDLRSPALEYDLVSPTRRQPAVILTAHGPGQQRQSKYGAGEQRYRCRQFLDRIGDELGPAAGRVQQPGHVALTGQGQLLPFGMRIAAFAYDPAS